MNIQTINKTQFQAIESIRQIITHDQPRRFASIVFEDFKPFDISWHSDSVEPIAMRWEYSHVEF
jgi:hypothetical protein